VLVTWDAATGTIDGYNVYRQTDGGAFTKLNGALIAATTFTDTAPVVGNLCYQVRSQRNGIESSPSASSCVNVTPPPPPSPPGDVLATLQSGAQVNVTWSAASGTIDGYNVYRQPSGGSFTKINAALVTGTSYSDPTPPVGNTCYQVRSQRTGTEGSASSSSCVTVPPPAAPSAPQNFTVQSQSSGGPATGNAAWTFDEATGQTVADATGNGNTATLGTNANAETTDPAWGAGVGGTGALSFDGSNDRCTVPDAPALRFAGSFTIEAWVQRGANGASHCIIAKGDSQRRNYWMLIDSSNRIDFRWETSGGSNRGVISGSNAIADANWHHIACVYDQTSGQSRIYRDGLLLASASGSGTPVTNADPVLIGARASGSLTSFFRGGIDLVRVSAGAIYSANFTPPTSYGGGSAQTNMQLAWQAPATGTAAGYNVYRQIDGGAYTKLNASLLTALTYTDTAVPAGALCYQVAAVDGFAQEGDEATACGPVTKATHTQTITAGMHASPNPFNPSTTIAYRVATAGRVRLSIYDVRGHRLVTLVDETREAGAHHVTWNGRDAHGATVASGAYFATLEAPGATQRHRIVLIK
jgi:hypothetical protein